MADRTLNPAERRRAVFAATLGNGLEFYDFVTFAFFAIQIGRTFFPSISPFLSLMGSLATFGAGFLTRPIGAFVLGGYADRHGRKPAMLISMMLMGCGILMLGLCPGYATIGLAAPVIAVMARLVQGFALGGEVGAASAYMMEAVTNDRRGYSLGWQGASQNVSGTIGALVGLILSAAMNAHALDVYGWRIALLLGALIVPIALLVRNSLPETHAIAPDRPARGTPLRPYARIIVLGAIGIGSGTIATYFFQYMATFGQHTLHLSERASFAGEAANNAIGVATLLLGGVASDRWGRKPVMIGAMALFGALIVPMFIWLTGARNVGAFVGANLILSCAQGAFDTALYAAISESLPAQIRARVFALVYSIPVAVFGGTTQLVITWMLHATGDPMVVAWYLTAVSAIGLTAVAFIPESAPARTRARHHADRALVMPRTLPS